MRGRRVAVVTGGGRGIGAAIAESLAATDAMVVTIDPLVALDGSAGSADPDRPSTAERIIAGGGSARASHASVTDRDALQQLFDELTDEFGGVDAVVNVAGISRPTGFATGGEDDWRAVLSVHLDGYQNVLSVALPAMAAAGSGRILGVTSGAGWRAADAGAYSCAKRAVAAMTWQLGRLAPEGVTINALSPIALTRMVTAAVNRRRQPAAASPAAASPASGRSGGLSLGAGMPAPEDLGPLGAHLVGTDTGWCRGQVIFAGGSELALLQPPRLLEVVRADRVQSLAAALDAVGAGAFGPAEAAQLSAGGGTPRFGPIFDEAGTAPVGGSGTCGIVTDHPEVGAAVSAALHARGMRTAAADVTPGVGFDAATAALAALSRQVGSLDAVVVATAASPAVSGGAGWEAVLADHRHLSQRILADAGWARAVADHARHHGRPLRLVTLTDATTAAGNSRAQAAAQLSRAAGGATEGRVAAFAVAVESTGDTGPAAELAAHLLTHPDATALAGAELVVGAGWIGLRSHPRPATSVVFGGPSVPEWLDAVLRQELDRW